MVTYHSKVGQFDIQDRAPQFKYIRKLHNGWGEENQDRLRLEQQNKTKTHFFG